MVSDRGPLDRYSIVAIVLHWGIALAIVALLSTGWWMVDAIKQPDLRRDAFAIYQLHKSIGLTVLLLSVIRLFWRLAHPVPPLPTGLTPFERVAARGTHVLFYILMIAMPIAGWLMVSASKFGLPTIVFGLFEWPHIPGVAELASKGEVEAAAKFAHKSMAVVMASLAILHVGAALKHQFWDRDDVLSRMLPWSGDVRRTRKGAR